MEIAQTQKEVECSQQQPEIVTEAASKVYLEFSPAGLPPVVISGLAPDYFLRGSLQDVRPLEKAIEEGKRRALRGGLAGVISYEGNYEFGFFSSWREDRVLEKSFKLDKPYELSLSPVWTSQEYIDKVRQTKQWIAAGDIYQACITVPLRGNFSGCAEFLYQNLRKISPAPMSGLWVTPEHQLLSASPELFLDIRQREVRTRPIKGTRPRGGFSGNETPESVVAAELLASTKERAELTMITDLERNDLGQICSYGSVVVEDFLQLEKYAQVFHLVSTVRGEMRPEISHPAALAACFPGGSITGAPKKRAREIIAELECGARGFYTGAMGYFGFDGNSRFNLMIRTLVLQGNSATYGSGAGIVADSDPATEWQETLAKARGVLALCNNSHSL